MEHLPDVFLAAIYTTYAMVVLITFLLFDEDAVQLYRLALALAQCTTEAILLYRLAPSPHRHSRRPADWH